MIKTYTSTYSMESIKYFRPDNMIVEYTCPDCGKQGTIDMADDVIEYPEKNKTVNLECDCEAEFQLSLEIRMHVEVKVTVL